jgi:hypothetical protein
MVASVTAPGALASNIASVQQTKNRAAGEINVASNARREIAVTAKFGPDPVTGSPFQIIAGDDVRAAETNDLERLSEANLSRISSQNSFQAQSSRSEQEFAAETEASGSDQAAQQSLSSNQSSFTQSSGVGVSDPSQRGNSIDLQI